MAQLVGKKSDWPAMNVTDRRFVLLLTIQPQTKHNILQVNKVPGNRRWHQNAYERGSVGIFSKDGERFPIFLHGRSISKEFVYS